MLGYLSVHEMATRTGLSEERIRQLIRTHQIRRAIKLGGWLVREEDFNAFLKSRLYSTPDGPAPGPENGDGNPPKDPFDSTGDKKQ